MKRTAIAHRAGRQQIAAVLFDSRNDLAESSALLVSNVRQRLAATRMRL